MPVMVWLTWIGHERPILDSLEAKRGLPSFMSQQWCAALDGSELCWDPISSQSSFCLGVLFCKVENKLTTRTCVKMCKLQATCSAIYLSDIKCRSDKSSEFSSSQSRVVRFFTGHSYATENEKSIESAILCARDGNVSTQVEQILIFII